MKKRILVLAFLPFLMAIGSCSSESESEDNTIPTAPVVVIKEAKITSYSKNSGETGETITIYGENFSDKLSDVTITFDGVAASITSTTATEIKLILPKTEKVLPKLELLIENRTINNTVQNDYSQNIGILPLPSTTEWVAIENTLTSDKEIKRVQMINDKVFYYTLDNYVFRTLDGGISWNKWAYNYTNDGGFWATKNGDGICYTLFGNQSQSGGVFKIPSEGNVYSSNNVWKEPGGGYPGIMSAFVDEENIKGTIISQKGGVYTSNNGGDFELVYNISDYFVDGRIYRGTEIDNDHIWGIGEKKENGLKYSLILFKNNTTDGWKYNILKNEPGFTPSEIYFADTENGFVLIRNATETKIYKSTNGGDTWASIYIGEKFTKLTFKDANIGWAIADTKIYKTIDGGKSWTLDYTNEQPIRNITYKSNVVWAVSKDKIIKRYL